MNMKNRVQYKFSNSSLTDWHYSDACLTGTACLDIVKNKGIWVGCTWVDWRSATILLQLAGVIRRRKKDLVLIRDNRRIRYSIRKSGSIVMETPEVKRIVERPHLFTIAKRMGLKTIKKPLDKVSGCGKVKAVGPRPKW